MAEKSYEETYDEFWKRIVEKPDGTLNVDQVKRELSDYAAFMSEVSKAYDELTGGKLSKPNTAAHHVVDAAKESNDEVTADLVLHDLLPQIEGQENRQAVIDYANDLHGGAYEQYLRDKEMQEKFTAERVAKSAG